MTLVYRTFHHYVDLYFLPPSRFASWLFFIVSSFSFRYSSSSSLVFMPLGCSGIPTSPSIMCQIFHKLIYFQPNVYQTSSPKPLLWAYLPFSCRIPFYTYKAILMSEFSVISLSSFLCPFHHHYERRGFNGQRGKWSTKC